MRVLILAAGRGTRISRYLSGKPKCTVDIGGITLIEYTISELRKRGIEDIAICVGYQKTVIQDLLSEENITYYFNPFFDVTNSIASIWFARDFIKKGQDIMLMNGDVFLEPSLIDSIIEERTSPVLFADSTRREEADYKFFYENDILIKYGKELTGKDISGEYVGVGKFNEDFVEAFMTQLELMIANQEHSVWWENVLYELTKSRDIYVKDVDGKFWGEVDYIEDYERILSFREYEMDFSIQIIQK